jgi:F-type H+-transporting ATPase subunit a
VALHSPLEQFVIKPIVPINVAGINLDFTQSAMWMLLAVATATLLMTLGMRKRELIPGRLQNIPEMFYEFIDNMVGDALGDQGRKFFPFVFSLFMIVLMGNLLGMLPYSFTFTSHIIVTGALAMFVLLSVVVVGVYIHGLHFFSLFLPKDLPIAMAPLVIVIELISFLSRPVSLSVRLFANMVAGHAMLKVFAGFSVMMGAFFGILPLLASIALIGLELMVAFIQAYVFAILTCIYLKDAVELH